MTLMKPEILILKKRKLAEDRLKWLLCSIEFLLFFFLLSYLYIGMNGGREEPVTRKPMCAQIIISNSVP